ncbi:MAG TPA: type II toxin-antitoxin system death-on-curing family toxin [Kiritimatiellia bacterium]|nr:type II toxin-antitoxin system death-on-curing family toxin [Kiritimatiellia bacterium]HMO99724.1 type II toxin-antitoxin system death-on-curing family toxin [Kiritimatiellia bacterium]HMP97423.1 type II toxin-antitoxin system death-on-curing family toxin [Kiritimatiellia bacterium]
MKEPIWVDREDCLAFQEEMLSRHGGIAGVRDYGLLESALHRPQQLFHYGSPSMFEMAAAYAAGIIKNHPFLDGNKRAGFIAAALFLEINGYAFVATEEDVVIQTLALAAGELNEATYAHWLKRVCEPADKSS